MIFFLSYLPFKATLRDDVDFVVLERDEWDRVAVFLEEVERERNVENLRACGSSLALRSGTVSANDWHQKSKWNGEDGEQNYTSPDAPRHGKNMYKSGERDSSSGIRPTVRRDPYQHGKISDSMHYRSRRLFKG